MPKSKANQKTTKKNKLAVYILLDRSGSMSAKWDETLSALNTFADKISQDKKLDPRLTLAVFDNQSYDILRDEVKAKDWKSLKPDEAPPRGWTPLYDSVGKIIAKADVNDDKRTQIVIITDGAENASREISKDKAKQLLDRCKEKKWDIVFLGADFDAMTQAASVGVGSNFSINTSQGNYGAAMNAVLTRSSMYASSGALQSFSDSDRAAAVGKVK